MDNNSKYKNEVYYSLAAMFLSYINRSNIDFSLEQGMELDKLFKMDMHNSWEEAVSFFKKISSNIFKLERDRNAQNGKNLVSEVQEYIRNNIGMDITLTQLSRVFHFNASYFSRLYKSLTGENVTDFMKRVRLEKAKDLLQNPDYKVKEVAERLGFRTSSYFTNFFKKNTNMTPQEYRQTLYNK